MLHATSRIASSTEDLGIRSKSFDQALGKILPLMAPDFTINVCDCINTSLSASSSEGERGFHREIRFLNHILYVCMYIQLVFQC